MNKFFPGDLVTNFHDPNKYGMGIVVKVGEHAWDAFDDLISNSKSVLIYYAKKYNAATKSYLWREHCDSVVKLN